MSRNVDDEKSVVIHMLLECTQLHDEIISRYRSRKLVHRDGVVITLKGIRNDFECLVGRTTKRVEVHDKDYDLLILLSANRWGSLSVRSCKLISDGGELQVLVRRFSESSRSAYKSRKQASTIASVQLNVPSLSTSACSLSVLDRCETTLCAPDAGGEAGISGL